MREVEVSRFVQAPPARVERALTPASVVEYEGTFTVRDVTETDGGWRVAAAARGLGIELVFEPRESGIYYRQEGTAGPFDAMETTLTFAPENEGTRIRAVSGVSLGLPLSAVSDRIAAWKRRGELDRALSKLAADLE